MFTTFWATARSTSANATCTQIRSAISCGASGDLALDVVVAGFYFEDEGGDELQAAVATLVELAAERGVVREYDLHLEPAGYDDTHETCMRLSEGGEEVFLTFATDYDCDGYLKDGEPGESDCFPFNGFFHPGADDNCDPRGPAIDGDCDGICDEDAPRANDEFSICGTDSSPAIDHICVRSCEAPPPNGPRSGEICDGFDTDCNELTLPHDAQTPCFTRDGDGGNTCRFGATACEEGDGANGGTVNATNCESQDELRAVLPPKFCRRL